MPRWVRAGFVAGAIGSALYLVSTAFTVHTQRPGWWDTWFYIGVELLPAVLIFIRVAARYAGTSCLEPVRSCGPEHPDR